MKLRAIIRYAAAVGVFSACGDDGGRPRVDTDDSGVSLSDSGIVSPVADCDQAPNGTPCGVPGAGTHCILGACRLNVCGDGVRAGTEQCDDGDEFDADGCNARCQMDVPGCGNGVLETGEECDDGNSLDSDRCTLRCTNARCGDAVIGPGEQCDDGNSNDRDSCTNSCTSTTVPGVDAGASDAGRDGGNGGSDAAADAGLSDASPDSGVDASAPDASTPDAGAPDAQVDAGSSADAAVDAAARDASPGEAAVPDAAPIDSAVPDASPGGDSGADAAPLDSSVDAGPDAAAPDAGGTATCEECRQRVDPEGRSDGCYKNYLQTLNLLDGCFVAKDLANTDGQADPAWIQQCTDIVTCARQNGCGEDPSLGPAACYCGVGADPNVCSANGPAAGAKCVPQWQAGGRSTDNTVLQGRFVDLNYPVAWAYYLLDCDRLYCNSAATGDCTVP